MKRFINWFKNLFKTKKKEIRSSDLEKIGAIVVMELHASRRLRRKIKGTKMERMILNVLKEENANK